MNRSVKIWTFDAGAVGHMMMGEKNMVKRKKSISVGSFQKPAGKIHSHADMLANVDYSWRLGSLKAL